MNFAVILAGGIGARFWPISTVNTPKQILNITGKLTPLQETIKRINTFIHTDNILVITNKGLLKEIKQQALYLGIKNKNILVEPSRKNTALPIVWAAILLKRIDPSSNMIILPSDHFIEDTSNFNKTIKKALKLADLGYLTTIGIKPSCPDTAYGYIKTKTPIKNVFKVDKFIEKPSLKKAKVFIKNKKFYWNSGIFVWKTQTIINEAKKHLPIMYNGLIKNKDKINLEKFWNDSKSISIDYGIMEKTKNIILIPASFKWIDIGSWDALDKVIKKDKDNNIIHAKSINIDSSNITVWSDDRIDKKRIIATIGLKDIIIVESKNAVLVCHKNNAQEVKKISGLIDKK